MDVEKLVEPVSRYLSFFLDFWLYCDGCLSSYSHLGTVSSDAFLLFLLGTGFYLVIRYADIKIVDPDPNPDHSGNPSISTNSVLLLFSMNLLSIPIFESSLWLTGARDYAGFGQVYSTINASLLLGAVTQPVTAIQLRLSFITNKVNKTSGWAKWPILVLNTVFGIFVLYLYYQAFFTTFEAVHGVQQSDLWPPTLVSLLASLALTIIFGKALMQWIKYARAAS